MTATVHVLDGKECVFYHADTMPDGLEVGDEWDLRQNVAEYLGHTEFKDKTVLEIGPASGYLTKVMSQSGAAVTCVDLPYGDIWDLVPRIGAKDAAWTKQRDDNRLRSENSWWHTCRANGFKARMFYRRVENLPDEAHGPYDVSVIAGMLLHTRDPMGIICKCASLTTKRMVITETRWFAINAPGVPYMLLVPGPQNDTVNTWWAISSDLIRNMLAILGFTEQRVIEHSQYYIAGGRWVPHYTVIGERP